MDAYRSQAMKTYLLLTTCLLFAGGCASRRGPAVSLVNVRLNEATALETTATFTLRLSNEEPEAVRFSGAVHKIYLNGRFVGKGLSADTVVVPRLDTLTQDVTVHLSNLALAARVKPVITSKRFDYRIESVFHGESGAHRLRSESEGRLDLGDFTPSTTSPSKPSD